MSAHFLHRLIQGRPFLIEAFILDLPQLRFGDFEALGDNLIRTAHDHPLILGGNQVAEDLPALLQGQAFGWHKKPHPIHLLG